MMDYTIENIPYESPVKHIIVKPASYLKMWQAAENHEAGFKIIDGKLYVMGFLVYSHELGREVIM